MRRSNTMAYLVGAPVLEKDERRHLGDLVSLLQLFHLFNVAFAEDHVRVLAGFGLALEDRGDKLARAAVARREVDHDHFVWILFL
jgi:hypothetical protein